MEQWNRMQNILSFNILRVPPARNRGGTGSSAGTREGASSHGLSQKLSFDVPVRILFFLSPGLEWLFLSFFLPVPMEAARNK